jgi:hypothetical protein
MKVEIAFNLDEARKISWQDEFPGTTKCVHCGGDSRLAFVAHEGFENEKKYICQIYENDPEGEGFWLHDCATVAVYFCKKCLEPTALYNQA